MNALLEAKLTPSEHARLDRNIEQLWHIRQNLICLGQDQAAFLIQRAIELATREAAA